MDKKASPFRHLRLKHLLYYLLHLMATPELDIAQLSEDRQLALQQYTAVTDQNLDAAVSLLQRCEWNVQVLRKHCDSI